MKGKIIGILVMALLIATVALPVSGSMESSKIKINNMGGEPLFQPPILWEKTYGSLPGFGHFVQQTSDDGYIATGIIYTTGGTNAEVYLVKTDANGNAMWAQTYGTVAFDVGYCVQQTSDGGYIIAGMYSGHALWLIKTDSNGNQQWNNVFTSLGLDAAYSVQQTSDGGYILVGGYHYSTGGPVDVWLIKTNANGAKQWDQKIGAGAEIGYCVRQTSDGGYIITGRTAYGAGQGDVYLIKTDAGGNPTWTQTFGGTSNEEGYSVRQTSDGGYIITGYTVSFGAGQADVYLIKTDSSGNPTWTQTFGGTNNDYGTSVRQTSDGGYIIGGVTDSFGPYAIYLIKTDAGGNKLWDDTFGVANTIGQGFPCADQTTDGGYIIAGTKYTTYSEFWLIKLRTNQPPDQPTTPSGPTSGTPGNSYPYETSATDPGKDMVEYGWDWTGNGVVDQWDNNGGNYYAPGEEITTYHSWPMKGTYNVKVVAKDINGAQGPWSNPLTVTMPRNILLPNTFFMRLFERFPNAFPIIRQILGL